MTRLWVPILSATFQGARAELMRAFEHGADGVELRLDAMGEVGEAELIELCGLAPGGRDIVLTYRSREEGGLDDASDSERISRLIAIGPYAHFIDVEHATWRRSANIRQKVMLALRRARHADRSGEREIVEHEGRRRLILSRHYLRGRPAKLTSDLLEMAAIAECDVIKLAWPARSIRDCFEAFELMQSSPRPIIAICMGEGGSMSRLLATKFGGFATFAAMPERMTGAGRDEIASTSEGFASANRSYRGEMGHVPIDEMRAVYRCESQRRDTAVYGVVGCPVGHSLGPAVHNAAFAAAGLDAVYLPMLVQPGFESLKAFMVEALACAGLRLGGVSITSPHKENALRRMEQIGGGLDQTCVRVGAVNTLRFDDASGPQPTNTDYWSLAQAMSDACRSAGKSPAGLHVLVLGAGGMARAAAAAMIDAGARVTVVNRSSERAEALAGVFGCEWRPWESRGALDAEAVINCTTVGQADADAAPIDADALKPGMIVADAVYRRRTVTRLIRDARASGCHTIDGLELFVRQAAAQWEFWTGRPAPRETMARAMTGQR